MQTTRDGIKKDTCTTPRNQTPKKDINGINTELIIYWSYLPSWMFWYIFFAVSRNASSTCSPLQKEYNNINLWRYKYKMKLTDCGRLLHWYPELQLSMYDVWAFIRFYRALYTRDGCLNALPLLLPLVTKPFKSFLKPSQLHGEYTACATNM